MNIIKKISRRYNKLLQRRIYNSTQRNVQPLNDYHEICSKGRTFFEQFTNVSYRESDHPIVSDMAHKWVGAQTYNDSTYFIPSGEDAVLITGDKNAKIESHREGHFKWTGGCVWNQVIYALPRSSNEILAINPVNDSLSFISLQKQYNGEHHYGGVCTEKGVIFQPPRNTDHILRIDLNTMECKTIAMNHKSFKVTFRYCGGVKHPNGLIYFFPESDGRVIKLNPVTEDWCFIGPIISTMCFDAKVSTNGNIYGFSANCNGIMKINVETDSVEMIETGIYPGSYGTKYGLNGKMYSVPGDGTIVYEFDPIKEECRVLFDLEDTTKAKYAGGVTKCDGEIILSPANAKAVKILTPDIKSKFPEEVYSVFVQDCY